MVSKRLQLAVILEAAVRWGGNEILPPGRMLDPLASRHTRCCTHACCESLPRSAPALAAQATRHRRRHVKHGLVAAVCRTSRRQALAGALARRRGHLCCQLAGSSCRQARRGGRRRRSLPLGREQQVGERGFTAPLHGWVGGRAAGLVEGAVREGAARHKRTKPCFQQQNLTICRYRL